jgi:hypothetical protein
MSSLATTLKPFRSKDSGTSDAERRFKTGLLVLGFCHLVYFCVAKYSEASGITGVLYPQGDPVGGDFINLWSVVKLILSDRIPDICWRSGPSSAWQC